jgi:hypothetical protein
VRIRKHLPLSPLEVRRGSQFAARCAIDVSFSGGAEKEFASEAERQFLQSSGNVGVLMLAKWADVFAGVESIAVEQYLEPGHSFVISELWYWCCGPRSNRSEGLAQVSH